MCVRVFFPGNTLNWSSFYIFRNFIPFSIRISSNIIFLSPSLSDSRRGISCLSQTFGAIVHSLAIHRTWNSCVRSLLLFVFFLSLATFTTDRLWSPIFYRDIGHGDDFPFFFCCVEWNMKQQLLLWERFILEGDKKIQSERAEYEKTISTLDCEWEGDRRKKNAKWYGNLYLLKGQSYR